MREEERLFATVLHLPRLGGFSSFHSTVEQRPKSSLVSLSLNLSPCLL